LELTRTMHTEYSRHGVIFRAHPMYRSKQAWHDWVMIRYEKSDAEKARNKSYQERSHADEVFYGDSPEVAKDHHYAPGKILAFVRAVTTPYTLLSCAVLSSTCVLEPSLPTGRLNILTTGTPGLILP
jgi:hypothetical protein